MFKLVDSKQIAIDKLMRYPSTYFRSSYLTLTIHFGFDLCCQLKNFNSSFYFRIPD